MLKTVIEHYVKHNVIYAVDYDVKFNSNKLCRRPHNMRPPPAS